jgi:hypothetical protein
VITKRMRSGVFRNRLFEDVTAAPSHPILQTAGREAQEALRIPRDAQGHVGELSENGVASAIDAMNFVSMPPHEQLAAAIATIATKAAKRLPNCSVGFLSHDLTVSAVRAAERFLQVKKFRLERDQYRHQLKSLKGSVEALQRVTQAWRAEAAKFDRTVTNDDSAPFRQLRSIYCYGDPNRTQPRNETQQELDEDTEREREWEHDVGPQFLREILEDLDKTMSDLERGLSQYPGLLATATESMKVPHTLPDFAKDDFVDALARGWLEGTGKIPGDTRDPSSKNEQRGPFGRYVEAIAKALLTAPFVTPPRGGWNWNSSIRKAVKGLRNKDQS